MQISPKCAVELLEIIKYLDDDLKSQISSEFINYLENIKDPNYIFTINKQINLCDNDFMDETIDILMQIIKF